MTLTLGTGPFGQTPAGVFNDAVTVDGRVIWWEDSPRRVRGLLDGETVVDSRRVKLLHESSLLPRWYFPREDIREDLLEATDHHTHCPIKGDASYYAVEIDGRLEEAIAWFYPQPEREVAPIVDRICFLDEDVDVEIDGEPQERPQTPFSRS